MYIDEILVYLVVACVTGLATAMLVQGWNRPFFRSARKAANAFNSPFPLPMATSRRRRYSREV